MPKRKSRPATPVPALLGPLLLAATFIVGCDRGASSAANPASANSTRPTHPVVSLSPAATDLLLAMGAGDAIVGVSTFETDPRVRDLPRVGDYLTADWERIASLAPEHLIAQMRQDKIPAGFMDRAQQLKVDVTRVQIDRLDDVPNAAEVIGIGVGREEAGLALSKQIRQQIDAVRARVAGKPPVKTLIVISDDGTAVAGPDTFLDDILVAAGGVNALGRDRPGYLKIDHELLASLAPDAIIHLTPPSTAAAREANGRLWASMPNVPAVADQRVLVIDEPWGLLPASHVVDLAKRFADHLHPEAK